MTAKLDILMIESTVQASDTTRWAAVAQQFNLKLIYDDWASTDESKQRMQPGGPYSQIVAIVRNSWLKTGPFAYQTPFASDVVPRHPSTLRLVCCSGHGHDTADVAAMTARRIWYCNTPDACTVYARHAPFAINKAIFARQAR